MVNNLTLEADGSEGGEEGAGRRREGGNVELTRTHLSGKKTKKKQSVIRCKGARF